MSSLTTPRQQLLRIALFCGAAIASFVPTGHSAPQVPWEYAPYRIEVLVAIDPRVPLSARSADELAEDLAARANATSRGVWQVTARAATATWRHRVDRLETLGLGDLPSDVAAKLDSLDKVLLLGVRDAAGSWQVVSRELDVATGEGGPLVAIPARDVAALLPAAHRAMQDAFCPLARIESVTGASAVLRLQGGSLPGRDAVANLTARNVIFRPILVSTAPAAGEQARTRQPIPWTYLLPTRTDGSRVDCRVETALAGEIVPPFHARRERLALGGRPSPTGTVFRVVRQDDPAQGVRGIGVYRDSEPPERIGLTGEDGQLLISGRAAVVPDSADAAQQDATSGMALEWLLVRSGEHPLARLPLVPGLSPQVVLATVDDSPRLAAETELVQLEDGVLDFVAERESLLARTLQARSAGDPALAALMQQVAALRGPEPLAQQLARLEPQVAALPPTAKDSLSSRVAAVRKVLDQLAAESPLDRLEEPIAPEPKPEE
jgi:hypothetical protein